MLRFYLRCVLLVWVFIISESFSPSGPAPPAPPARPDCFMLCDENCQVDINCTWAPGPGPQTPSNYSLHWETTHSKGHQVFVGPRLHGLIQRDLFLSHDELRVWVRAENQFGSVKSPEAEINTANIFKPPPPKVWWSEQEPLGISWTSSCDQLRLSLGSCDVRHRTEAGQDWMQEESDHGSFTFVDPQPCSLHEVQVRCSCNSAFMSDWSESYRKTSTGAAPVAELDVWRDCGKLPQGSECVLTWKKLPPSLACGSILGYEVSLTHLSGSVRFLNVSETEQSDRLVCEEKKCFLNSSLKDVSSVSVSAFNAHGANTPSNPLSVSESGGGDDQKGFYLEMNEKNLTATWNVSFSETLKEFVLQVKRPGSPLGRGLDWVRVTNAKTSATLNGHFEAFTPFQVSLLSVSLSHLSSGASPVHTLWSEVGFSFHGIPPKVPSFQVLSIGASNVTVSWKPIPVRRQNGTILFYQIGVNGQEFKVYNVSSSKTSKQLNVQPGRTYEAWIRAVTKAGPGENATVSFRTKLQIGAGSTGLILSLIFALFLVCVALLLSHLCPAVKTTCPLMRQCYEKVPDPGNSFIFRQKNQIHELSGRFPLYESHPKLCLLEVVENQSWAFKPTLKKNSVDPTGSADRSSQLDATDEGGDATGDGHRTDSKNRAEAYRKIIDSEEEEEGLSEEEELVGFGYEKHFMPSAAEIQ